MSVHHHPSYRHFRCAVNVIFGALALAGCGGTADPGNTADETAAPDAEAPMCESSLHIDVSGQVSLYPITIALDPEATLEGAELLLRDPILSVQGKPSVLVDASCNETRAPVSGDFSFRDVDVSTLAVGLIATVDDPEGATEDKWMRASAGLAAGRPSENVTGAVAFAVTMKSLEQLAPLIPGDNGTALTPPELVERGLVLGLFLRESDGAPVEGVVLVNQEGEPIEEVIYPSTDLSTSGEATSDNGIFILPTAPLKSYSGQKDGWTFAEQQAASAAGGAFLLTLLGSEQ